MTARRILTALMGMLMVFPFAAAEGVTLRTVSCFAGADTAAEAYVDILNLYETESGNTVIDHSSASDEAWKTGVLHDFAAGNEPDVLFFFAAGADSAPILCPYPTSMRLIPPWHSRRTKRSGKATAGSMPCRCGPTGRGCM